MYNVNEFIARRDSNIKASKKAAQKRLEAIRKQADALYPDVNQFFKTVTYNLLTISVKYRDDVDELIKDFYIVNNLSNITTVLNEVDFQIFINQLKSNNALADLISACNEVLTAKPQPIRLTPVSYSQNLHAAWLK